MRTVIQFLMPAAVTIAMVVAGGRGAVASAAQGNDCGCTDDAPFLRNPVDRRPTIEERDGLLTGLSSPSCETAAGAARRLGMLHDAQAIAPLIRTLRHSSCRVRVAAADALGEFQDSTIVPALAAVLSDPDRRVRADAGWSLANVGDERALPELLVAITDTSKHVRQAATTALGHVGDPRAGPALTKALRDPEKHVRLAAAEALGRLRRAPATVQRSETPAERCTWEGWLPPSAGRARVRASSAVDAQQEATLRELARSPSKARRQEAALKLAASREAASVDVLLQLTNDGEPQVVDAAVRSLGRIGDHRATATLLPLVSAADAHVRQGAAWALGQLEDASTNAALISATRDDNKHVRTEATWALGLAGNRTAGVSRLIELTRDGEEHVRLAAVCSLASVGSNSGTQVLDAVSALRTDSVAVVRDAAAWAARELSSRTK